MTASPYGNAPSERRTGCILHAILLLIPVTFLAVIIVRAVREGPRLQAEREARREQEAQAESRRQWEAAYLKLIAEELVAMVKNAPGPGTLLDPQARPPLRGKPVAWNIRGSQYPLSGVEITPDDHRFAFFLLGGDFYEQGEYVNERTKEKIGVRAGRSDLTVYMIYWPEKQLVGWKSLGSGDAPERFTDDDIKRDPGKYQPGSVLRGFDPFLPFENWVRSLPRQ